MIHCQNGQNISVYAVLFVCVCADVTCEYDGDELSLGESVTDSDDGCTRW